MVTVRMGDPSDPHLASSFKGRPGGGTSVTKPSGGSQTFEMDMDGMTPEQARRWVDVQIPYPNLAGDPEVAQRAVGFVKHIKNRYEEGTVESREKWRAMQWMLRGGNTLAERFQETDLHVPELYKLIEALVPRVEEAIIGNYDPWFTARGRTQNKNQVAKKVVAYMMAQLRNDHFDHKVQPAIRAMLEYAFCAFKIYWDVEIAHRMVKKSERLDPKNGKRRYKQTREYKEEVVWNGPRLRLIDPLDMIVDLRSVAPPHDALYVGDQQWYTLDELKAQASVFGYENIDELEEGSDARPESGYRDFDKQSRSLERYQFRNREDQAQGAPKRVRVTELWCMFDPSGGHDATPHVLTIANDKVCLRVQENFHDNKHIPYAIARASRDGWEFLNVGPCDHALSIAASIDTHRNLALRGHENHLCPPLFADDTAGLPDNLFDVAPGTVFQVQTGSMQWHPAPSTLADYSHMFDIERRDMEEIIGSPRIWEGTAGGDKTATATERKVQEANRRVRSYVLSFSFMLKTALEQVHALNRQFVTQDMPFAVIGRAAKDLGMYTEVGPNDFDSDLEFDFTGLGALRTLDLRATQLQTFMSTMYPFMQMHPGVIDVPKILGEAWDVMVGTIPADSIVKSQGNLDELLPQDEENYILQNGERLRVHPLDVDQHHIFQMHMHFGNLDDQASLEKNYGVDAAKAILDHYAQHLLQAKQKMLRKQAEMEQPSVVPNQMAGYDAGRGTTGNRQMPGNPPNADTGGQGLAGIPNQTPGPGMSRQVAAPDRNAPVPQRQNMGSMQ